MDNVDSDYIGTAINELINLVGIKEGVHIEFLLKPLYAGNVKGCIENIASYLGLPVAINLLFSDKFESSALATTDRNGRGVGGVTAQVSIPSYLPLYGTPELKGFPITVKVSHNCKNYPLTFLAAMAHELSHIVLHSLWCKEKDNEFYTELTVMLLGFSEVMKKGRKIEETRQNGIYEKTATATYGYFSDIQFYSAYNKIGEIWEETNSLEKKVLEKLATHGRQISSYKKEAFLFNKFLEHLDKNRNKRIRKEDGSKIVLFHRLDYTDKFTAVIRRNEAKLKEIYDFLLRTTLLSFDSFDSLIRLYPRHYTPQILSSLRKFDEEIDTLVANLDESLNLLKTDIRILGKYVGFLQKRKIKKEYSKSIQGSNR